MLYEMISGHQPFSAKTMAETISAILVSEPPPLASYSIRAPSGVERILRKCLEKDREQRFQAMAEVAADLETVRRQCESGQIESSISNATTARREAVTRRQPVEWRNLLGRRGAFALAAVVILAAVTATVLFVRRPAAPPGSKSVNSPAYDDFMHGKVMVSAQNRESNERAIELLQRAVRADSGFAPAWAEMARAYTVKATYFASESERKHLNVEAEVAVEKALRL